MGANRESHLDAAQLTELAAGKPASAEASAHLRLCALCAETLALYGEIGGAALADTKSPPADLDACPPPETWPRVTEDPQTLTDGLMDHIAHCDICAGQLTAALSLPQPPVEAPPALDPAKRRLLAERMARSWHEHAGTAPAPRLASRIRRPWLWAAPAALIAAAAVIWLLSPSTDRLIDEAYAERRPVEFRVAGAGYAPLRVERGAARPDRPASLLEADARVTRGLASRPDEPALLQQKGRIELLDGEYQSALPMLQRAAELRPDELSVLLDLSLGYFERAEAENRPVDYGTSVELLSRVLAKQPSDRVALFNRAIALERLMMYSEAIRDWTDYLRLDASGPWADEARMRMETVQKKLSDHAHSITPCDRLSAGLLVDWNQEGMLDRQIAALEGGFECLRQKAIVDWYPASFADSAAGRLSRRALQASSALFRDAAGDTWLADLTGAGRIAGAEPAARLLADAVAANLAVDAARAETAAARAIAAFRTLGNRAGEAQASVEYLYAIRRAKQGSDCREIAERILPSLARSIWRWTDRQARLEESSCLSMTGGPGEAERMVRGVLADSGAPVYASLNLRALSYLEGLEAAGGDDVNAWRDGEAGLQRYWAGRYSPVWAYQLFFHLAVSASSAGKYDLALRLQRATLEQIRRAARPNIEAFTWFDYGRTALLAGELAEANTALSTASGMLAGLPQDRALRTTMAECQIDLAEIDLRQRRAAQARDRLARIVSAMDLADSFPLQFAYRRSLALADDSLGRSPEYRKEIDGLVGLSDRAFESFAAFRDRQEWARKVDDVYRRKVALEISGAHDPSSALAVWEQYRDQSLGAKGRAGADSSTASGRSSQKLVYVALEDRLLIWASRGGRVVFRPVSVSRDVLEQLANRLYVLCSSPDTSQEAIRRVSSELSAYVLSPVEDELEPGAPLWVEFDDALSSIPFGLLPLHSGSLVIDRFPWAAVPALSLAGGGEEEGGGGIEGGRVLAVGISSLPSGDLNLPPLPGAVAEAEEVARRYPNSRLLLNDGATDAKIKREMTAASVFHFAGHSMTDANETALVVAAGSGGGVPGFARMGADQISRMDLKHCRLAVLSACSAEKPKLLEERPSSGLATALLMAGVRGVLAPRWDLDSDVALTYSKNFYETLDKGETAMRAANTAALAVRANPKTSHPYYWADYEFFGGD